MLDPTQFKEQVIRPTLMAIGLWSPSAEVLLLGTALTESGLVYLHQLHGGPALGLYQDEPADHNDLWKSFLPAWPHLTEKLQAMMTPESPLQQLVTNLRYATAICRIHYLRAKPPLPAASDAADLAGYHKRFYNTALGATD